MDPRHTPPTIDAQGLLDARNELKMSQVTFAEALGVKPNTIYRWEQGAKIQMMPCIARAVRDLKREAEWHELQDQIVEDLARDLEPYVAEAIARDQELQEVPL